MFDNVEREVIRRAYARQTLFLGRASSPRLEAAFAEVPREAYLPPGPWQVLRWPGGYVQTPDADPAWLYSDILVAIAPERGLNNGQPSAHATWIEAVDPLPGDHVVHVGAGLGYFSAILAHMAGPSGRLTAIEFDPGLAARASANLTGLGAAEVIQGDGSLVAFERADVIYVNAGASRPAEAWLDGLKDGGRLILPLTTDANFTSGQVTTGAVFLITRRGEDFEARLVSPIAVFPCAGARDAESEQALAAALRRGGADRVRRLRRTDALHDKDCWLKAPGWSLTFH